VSSEFQSTLCCRHAVGFADLERAVNRVSCASLRQSTGNVRSWPVRSNDNHERRRTVAFDARGMGEVGLLSRLVLLLFVQYDLRAGDWLKTEYEQLTTAQHTQRETWRFVFILRVSFLATNVFLYRRKENISMALAVFCVLIGLQAISTNQQTLNEASAKYSARAFILLFHASFLSHHRTLFCKSRAIQQMFYISLRICVAYSSRNYFVPQKSSYCTRVFLMK